MSRLKFMLCILFNLFFLITNYYIFSFRSNQGYQLQQDSHFMNPPSNSVEKYEEEAEISVDYKTASKHETKQYIDSDYYNDQIADKETDNDSLPLTDIYKPLPSAVKRPFPHYTKDYPVPSIPYTDLVNCEAFLAGDPYELDKADAVNLTVPKVPIYEETYLSWTVDCEQFKIDRGYILAPLSEEEENYPLAFSIAVYTDFEQIERLVRMIYQPQNYYCIHVDTKAPLLIHRTIQAYARCFHNVWIATHLDKVKWGDVSVLLPAINCMRDMVKFRRGKWKYFINLTGQEMPLRTNWEMVQIAKIFNGSNDIGGSIPRMDLERVNYIWTHRWSKTYQQTIFYNTYQPKPPFQVNVTFFKGELHGFFSHNMAVYIIENPISRAYLRWCWDSGHPTEHYWNVLNYNTHLRAPGGYQGSLELADQYSYNLMIRVKNWAGFYDNRVCQGKDVRGICVYGARDAPWLATRHEMVANKFHLTYQYLAYDCLEERHRNRTKMRDKVPFAREYYENLPTVKYSRKDGL